MVAIPSAINFKMRFPAFETVPDADIEFAIEEAISTCGALGTGWIDDYNHTMAIMQYAAHLIQVAILRADNPDGRVIASESTPEMSISYAADSVSSATTEDFSSTPYGVKFCRLVSRNFPAILTVGSAVQM